MVTLNPLPGISDGIGSDVFQGPSSTALNELALTKAPRVLLVDDDPVFCRSMKKTAEKNKIDLKVCQTMGEVMRLVNEGPYDVAVLDFQFGELTALQVGHFLAEETPILITSNHRRAEVHIADWPFDIRDFVGKSVGNAAILNRALGIGKENQNMAMLSTQASKSPVFVWMLLAFAASTIAAFMALALLTGQRVENREFFWDSFRFMGNHAMIEQRGNLEAGKGAEGGLNAQS